MKYIFTFFVLTLLSIHSFSQTWADDAAEVIYNKCTSCHHTGGIAPFSLMTYNDAYTNRIQMLGSVAGDGMPPWTADTNYQKYSHERFLSANEKSTLINWLNSGAQSGNLSNAPSPPAYNSGQLIPTTPDLVLKMDTYRSKASSTTDDYSCFVIPSGLLSNKKIKAIEVVPGNSSIVHHCLVYKVPSGSYSTDTSGFCGGPTSSSDQMIAGYTPGASPTVFPSDNNFKSGVTLSPNNDILFAMHYPAGSAGLTDSTKVNFYFYPDNVSGLREITAAPLISKWNFCIDSGAIDTISNTYPPSGALTADYSVLSVFPHMHLIGQSIESYAVDGANDTIPFIKIPIWDFDWQDFYFFERILKVPSGSVIHGSGVYNNKPGANPHFPNPNPVRVCSGFNTTDEMFLIYYHFMQYQAGDENINTDSLNKLWLDSMYNLVSIEEQYANSLFNIEVYPNPTTSQANITYDLKKLSNVVAIIYDNQGRFIKRLYRGKQTQGKHLLNWNGDNEQGEQVRKGIYHCSMLIDGVPVHKTIQYLGR